MVSIVSEKVTEIIELNETEVSESDGDVEETVGEVVSEESEEVDLLPPSGGLQDTIIRPRKRRETSRKENLMRVTCRDF